MSDSLQPHGLYSLWNSLGQNTGVDNLSLLHGIFPTQGSNPGSSALADGFFTSSTTWGTLKVKVKVSQSCLTLCNPMVCVVHGVLPDRIPEQVAFLFSRGSSNPGIKPRSPALQADSLPAEPQGKPFVLSTIT